jgi:hypothetical protein
MTDKGSLVMDQGSFMIFEGSIITDMGLKTQLDTPTLMIDNGSSTQLIAHLTAVTNARSYQVQVKTPDGKVVATVVSTQARSIVIPGLTPGVIYTLQGQAVGGSTGFSDWSDPVSHMCM